MPEKPNVHEGHRQRVKDKYIKGGLEKLPEHEILEALLFYSVKMGNTNITAHNLINRFGSLRGALEASYDELLTVEGIGEHSASMIVFFSQMAKVYFNSRYPQGEKLDDSTEVAGLCRTLFMQEKTECAYLLCLTSELKLISKEMVSKGSFGQVEMTGRAIAELCFKYNCERIIISHNHPFGSCMPSRNDVHVTKQLAEALKFFDIGVIDHVIVGIDGEWSMREHCVFPEIWS